MSSDKSFGVVTRCFTFPVVSGVVTISVPFPMSEDDYISLTEILAIMKAGLVPKTQHGTECGHNNAVDHSEFGLPLGYNRRCGTCGRMWNQPDKPR